MKYPQLLLEIYKNILIDIIVFVVSIFYLFVGMISDFPRTESQAEIPVKNFPDRITQTKVPGQISPWV